MTQPTVIIRVSYAGNDANDGGQNSDGTVNPVATVTRAFSLLPPTWQRAEIVFAPSATVYTVTARSLSFGEPVGTDAKSLVIRGAYEPVWLNVRATEASAGDSVRARLGIPEADELIGNVLMRTADGLAPNGTPNGTAVSIRGNTTGPDATIFLQGSIGEVAAGDLFVVQRPGVTLEPLDTLNLIGHDGRSPNLTLVGIKIAPRAGKGLNLINVRAQCDTCEFEFKSPARDTSMDMSMGSAAVSPVMSNVHTNARIQGGIAELNLAPGLTSTPGRNLRAQAGLCIKSDNRRNIIRAVRGGVIGGHLTLDRVIVQASQGGVFVPTTLEARRAGVRIMAGGLALAEAGGWGTADNRARIRDVEDVVNAARVVTDAGDGIRLSNGGSLHSPLSPIQLDVYGCARDGIHLEVGSTASFGAPGGATGLVTTGAPNRWFGLNVRTGSRAFIGADAEARLPQPRPPAPEVAPVPIWLRGRQGDVALDDVQIPGGWNALTSGVPRPARCQSNEKLSVVCVNNASTFGPL